MSSFGDTACLKLQGGISIIRKAAKKGLLFGLALIIIEFGIGGYIIPETNAVWYVFVQTSKFFVIGFAIEFLVDMLYYIAESKIKKDKEE